MTTLRDCGGTTATAPTTGATVLVTATISPVGESNATGTGNKRVKEGTNVD